MSSIRLFDLQKRFSSIRLSNLQKRFSPSR